MQLKGEISRCENPDCPCPRRRIAIAAAYPDSGGAFVVAHSRDFEWCWLPTRYERDFEGNPLLPVRGIAWGWGVAEILTDNMQGGSVGRAWSRECATSAG